MTLEKPSSSEEEYFARLEAEKKKKLAEKKQEELTQAEREQLKNVHWMHCPKCGFELHPIVYRGVTVDKCFHCNGIYLDDGELEKIAGKGSSIFHDIAKIFK